MDSVLSKLLHPRLITINDAIILAATSRAHPLAKLDHDQKYRCDGQANKSGRDEAVLIAQISQPRSNTSTCQLCTYEV
jgi:hypothetical protein